MILYTSELWTHRHRGVNKMIFDFGICISFLSYACVPSEILIVIFLWNQIRKRDKIYTSVYYILLCVGYAISVTYSLGWLLNNLFIEYSKVFDFIANLIDWYFLMFCGFWNFVVGLYRCTALGFPLHHKKVGEFFVVKLGRFFYKSN